VTEFTIQDIRGAVARGWCADANRDKEMDSVLAEAIAQEVFALVGATLLGLPYPTVLPVTNNEA
jgi:hypothetical protein